MAKERNVIQLSFKNEGADLELYRFLKQKLNAPSYIKEELWSIYKYGTAMQRMVPPVYTQIDPSAIQQPISAVPAQEELANIQIDNHTQEEEPVSLLQEEEERDEIPF